MRLHLRNMVMSAGATPDEVDVVADAVRQEGGNITPILGRCKIRTISQSILTFYIFFSSIRIRYYIHIADLRIQLSNRIN